MDDGQRTDLDSARGVSLSFADFQAFVDGDAELKATQTWLKTTIEAVDAAAAIQRAGRGGAKEIKDNLRTEGNTIVVKWLDGLKGVATSDSDADLKNTVKISESDYKTLPENEWYQQNLLMLPLCTQHLAKVSKYGRTAAEITTLTALNEAFKEAMPGPEKALARVTKATADLAEGLDDINTRLRKTTDALVSPYEEVQPEFVRRYFLARRKI